MKLFIVLRSVLVTFLIFPVFTFLVALAVVIVAILVPTSSWIEWLLGFWGSSVCGFYGVKIKQIHDERIPPEGGCVVLFNHTSFFDIFALMSAYPEWRFGAKIELFSIPIFGAAMRKVGTLPIARANRESAIRVLQEAEARARAGQRFVLSPEGGRNLEERLLPFKSGPFLFAISAQVPVLPVIIKGARDIWPKGALVPATATWRSELTLEFLFPISTSGLEKGARVELQEQVRNQMLPFFEHPPAGDQSKT